MYVMHSIFQTRGREEKLTQETSDIEMKVLVPQSCLTPMQPPDCSLPEAPLSMEFAGENPGVGWHSFLQGIFPTQRLNLGLRIVGRLFAILTSVRELDGRVC